LLPCVVLSLAGVARAESEPIRIEYRADRGCPNMAEFEERVFDRTASARLATPSETARTFSVDLRRAGRRVTGRLVIREPNGATMTRRVSGSDCGDVATVLALATALAIDPRAELAPHETLEEGARTSTERSASEVRGETPSDSPPGRDAGDDGENASESPYDDDGGGGDRSASTSVDVSLSGALGGRAALFATPHPAWGVSGFLGAALGGSLSTTELFLELAWLTTAPERLDGASASFGFLLGRPGVCAFGSRAGASVRVSPCLAVELGAITAEGNNIPRATSSTRFWAAAELFARVDLAFAEDGFVTLTAGAGLPFTRYEFLFLNPDTAIHRVPVLTAAGSARIGTRF
jgi:hypothetical protein